MEDQLVGYLLNALEPDEKRQVETFLRQHPSGAQKLELLRQALRPLDDERSGAEPPPGLADRTIAFVTEHPYTQLPRAPRPTARTPATVAFAFWRRADVLLAACLLIVVTGAALSWISHVRHLEGILECANDLREIHHGLRAYDSVHGGLPSVQTIARPPRNVAGLIVPKLVDAGCLNCYTPHCPGMHSHWTSTSYQKAIDLSDDDFARIVEDLTPCYGYTLGYRDGDGMVHGPKFNTGSDSKQILMADRAPDHPEQTLHGNSPNHGGYGQNVLFVDGSVKYVTDRTRSFNGDDLYLNKAQQVKAGLDWEDFVVGSGWARP